MKIIFIFSSLFNLMEPIPLFCGPCLTTKDVSESDSLQEAQEAFASVCTNYLAKWVPWPLEIAENAF